MQRAELPGGAVPSNNPERTGVPSNVNLFYQGGGGTTSGRHAYEWRTRQVVSTCQIEFPRDIRFSRERRSEVFETYADCLARGPSYARSPPGVCMFLPPGVQGCAGDV